MCLYDSYDSYDIYLSIYLSIYVSMYLCIYVSIYLSIYVSMYLCIYVSMYLCIYVSMYLCIYVCMYVSIYLSIYLYFWTVYRHIASYNYMCDGVCDSVWLWWRWMFDVSNCMGGWTDTIGATCLILSFFPPKRLGSKDRTMRTQVLS